MYEFLGVLFGCCIRTGFRFPLDLSSYIWKPLVGDSLTPLDLQEIDQALFDLFALIEHSNEQNFESTFPELNFTSKLSDKSTIELKKNGAKILVNYHNRMEWINKVIEVRLNEHKQQIDAIRRGIGKIIPLHLLNLLTLENYICGKPYIDIDLLRRHTTYDETLMDTPTVEMFWNVLHSFDQHQRRLFIRFAWAQERLPADDAEFIRSHTRLLLKPPIKRYPNPDLTLPRSDTCFFNLELPAYSSEKIMYNKLLYAITSDTSMNADEHVEDIHGTQQPASRSRGFGARWGFE